MAPGERHQVVSARTTKRLDHIKVVAAGAIERFRKRICIRPDTVDLLGKEIDRFDQTGIAAETEQNLVKTEVAVKDGEQVACGNGSGMLSLQFLQPLDILSANRKRNDANRHHFQFLANRVDLLHLQR